MMPSFYKIRTEKDSDEYAGLRKTSVDPSASAAAASSGRKRERPDYGFERVRTMLVTSRSAAKQPDEVRGGGKKRRR